jgi:hypothetical protein
MRNALVTQLVVVIAVLLVAAAVIFGLIQR